MDNSNSILLLQCWSKFPLSNTPNVYAEIGVLQII